MRERMNARRIIGACDHLSYANVMSSIAVFGVLAGGGAYAASKIGAGDIKKNAVLARHIRANQIGTTHLKNGAVTKEKLATNAIGTGPAGPPGPSGPPGALGLSGDPGPAGAQGPEGVGLGAFFGDGSDGDVVISTDMELSRDRYFDDLTIEPGARLSPNGYRMFVNGTLTLGNGAQILRNGPDGGTASGGAALPSFTLGGSGKGGGSGSAGEAVSNSLGGNSGTHAATPPPESVGGGGVFKHPLAAISGRSLDGAIVNGGAGGSGGSSGGAAGGGVIVIAARQVEVPGSATIAAKGGDVPPMGGTGASGGGGVIVVIATHPKPDGLTLNVDGGIADAGDDGQPGFKAWLF